MNDYYVAAWHTVKPKMVCLLDIVPKGKEIRIMRVSPVLTYSKSEFYKYKVNYQTVTKEKFEALHGEIKYP